jgi:hypothetical protein
VSNNVIDLLFKIVDFASSLHSRGDNYRFESNLKTRLTRISPSAILAFAFETYLSLFNNLFDFVGKAYYARSASGANNEILMSFDFAKYRQTVNSLRFAFQPLPVQQANGVQLRNNETISKALTYRGKLAKEEKIIKEVIERLDKTIENVDVVYNNAAEFINGNKTSLNQILDSVDGSEKIALLTEGQIRLFQNALHEFNNGAGLTILTKREIEITERSPREQALRRQAGLPPNDIRVIDKQYPIFVDSSIISVDELDVIYDTLEENKYRSGRADNLKIMTVGIPTGFIEKMTNLVSLGDIRISQINGKEKDVISINVFRKSIDFEDIVFNPIPHIFELSRFVSKSVINRLGALRRTPGQAATAAGLELYVSSISVTWPISPPNFPCILYFLPLPFFPL